ncbi:efflux RND transporter periplasmic adaptor subunit [Cellulophaga sp. F20128]|uniref:efflux RND transporter periplasmic adaptor subunit n=1 Tax=Cellulophaga sp. F20128 TaxID=2926413 RepID=UPI001FF0EAF7|nr:efflux RND transporter periplasmic adaptor subunit [Cellulophaga sp. F20128]MCK0156740.1 efflux RND transporter periplasmic adaptor subunit [Cellulophaga sp. F20128]
MKKYYYIAILLVSSFTACKNNNNTTKATADTTEGEAKGQQSHGKEVMLSAQQFNTLQMETNVLSKRAMSGFVEANGQLEVPPQNEAAITAIIGATIVSIDVIEGDKVNKGQVVAYLSHPTIVQMQTNYLNAYSRSIFLKKEFDRQKKLYEAGVGSGSNYQKSESEYKVSKAMENGLGAQLKLLNINVASVGSGTIFQRIPLLSPIDGFVQKVNIKTGQYVDPQTELFEVVDTHHIHADLMVFEKDVHLVKEGQNVTFKVQSMPDEELVASIVSVGKTFEENPKAVHIHAEIQNKKDNLIPGMYIQGKIEINSKRSKVLPEGALVKDGGKFFVFMVAKENDAWSFKPMEVRKGNTVDHWVAVNFLNPIDTTAKFAYNNAYYLMAEMKKGEAEHSH